VNAVISLGAPQNGGKLLIGCTTGGLSRKAKLQGVSSLVN
jgi:hypothetical protein